MKNHWNALVENVLARGKPCWGSPGGTNGLKKKKSNLSAKVGSINEVGLIPELGRSPGGGHGNPLQYFCLENPTDRGAWRATVHQVAKSCKDT